MSTQPNAQLNVAALAKWLVQHRFATLTSVWDLTLADVRLAARIAAPSTAHNAPTQADLAALMNAFPDCPEHKPKSEDDDGHHV